jgi:predicted DNA-binding transcriptional regulator AlpA
MLTDTTTAKIWLSARQVRERYGGRSAMWIERRLKADSRFPRPRKFGRLRFWDRDAIEAWERDMAPERQPARAATI